MSFRKAGNGELAERIERVTEAPMVILALVYLVIIVLENMPNLSPGLQDDMEIGEYFIVAIFAAELVVKVAVAKDWVAYLRSHWLDVLIVIAPFLRPLRVLRVLRIIPVFCKFVIGLDPIMRRYKGVHVLTVGLLSVLLSAVLMTEFEGGSGGTVKSLGDALWWAMATITTVGYGDVVPVTPEGKAVGVFLMIIGISLFGVLTAGISAYFVENTVHKERGSAIKEVLDQIKSLETRIEEQNALLNTLRKQQRN